jgi:hypothetical protein
MKSFPTIAPRPFGALLGIDPVVERWVTRYRHSPASVN